MAVKRKFRRTAKSGADLKSLGRRIREVRGFDISQQEFAMKLGISQSQLSKYERGLIAPGADVLLRLKERFGISIDWLLTGQKGKTLSS